MAKMKVHELAKELGRQSKELIAFLQDKGYEVKVAQSSIEDEAIEQVRKQFGGAAKPQDDRKKAEAKAAPEAETKAEAVEA
ncbi:MAG: translation initiation factor IF-2 N-terminal domain-containing protein, partial [Lachnospiraceae bacterium]|nr:translation initiation factor IF-2 N-terminal domain-containing protein [Lachnospiraceae bacterium]